MTKKSTPRKNRDIMSSIPDGYTSFTPLTVDWVRLLGPGKPPVDLNVFTGALREAHIGVTDWMPPKVIQ